MDRDISNKSDVSESVSEQIFISYRWQNNPDDNYFESFVRFVEKFTGLRAAWDKEFLRSGNFKLILAQKVASCLVLMPIVTEEYLAFGSLGGRENDGDYCLFELAKAVTDGRKIVPMLCCKGGNIQTVSDDEARLAAERVLKSSCTNEDLLILQKHLLSQNGVYIDREFDTREDQLFEKRESLSSLIFDTFCKRADIPFYKDFLRRQAERLNPVRVLGDYSSEGLTLENSYVPKILQRHLTEAEKKDREKRRESTAPTDAPEDELLNSLAHERFCVLTGDAGQGKSAFAKHACIALAKGASDNGLSNSALFPLYFECKNIDPESLKKRSAFLNELAADSLLPRPALEALLRHGRALFIFDAMDEVSPTQMDNLLEAIHSHLILEKGWSVRVLFTTRPGQKLVSRGGDMTLDHAGTVVRRYSVKAFDERQRDEYIRKLAPALRADESLGNELIAALCQKEREIPDYKSISRNPFMLFALFSTYLRGAELPETRFDAIVSVMNNMIKRDIDKNKCGSIGIDEVKTVLGAAAYRLYRDRDVGERPHADNAALIEKATELYKLDKTDRDDRKLISEYKTLFGAGGLFDESGFRHEFLAATYAAYYLLFLMKRRKSDGNSPIDETEAAALRSGTDYWSSVAEALLCLLDSTSEDSKAYLEPLLEELQNADTPEYDTLCDAVSQFKRHRARAAVVLLSGMIKRGCDGLESGGNNEYHQFICENGANPYEELFYYPAAYPALREFLPNLSTVGGSAEREYLRGELKKEVCALFSENEWESLQSVYASRVDSAYPELIGKMGAAAFMRDRSLKGFVRIPDGETEIGNYAFSGCTGLTSITIPSTVKEIGSWAFFGCNGLTNIIIPSSVTEIGKWAFCGCNGLTNIIIPSSVTEIGVYAFSRCTGLTSITIQEGVTKIGRYAFSRCTRLTSISIPSSVTEIGAFAFEGCTWLTSITIPSSVTKIGKWAFYGCTGLTSITIPSSVTKIGDGAFAGCSGLESIIVDAANSRYHSVNSCIIETESKTLIAGCKNSLIPTDGSVTVIGALAFSGYTGLTSITIPGSVTKIGRSAFSGCTGLTSITIPSGVTQIGDWAFSGCTGLTSINIPSNVTEIGFGAFFGCTGLTSITIPSSVTRIEWNAFDGCTGLKTVYYTGSEAEWKRINFTSGNDPLTKAEIVFNYRG